MNWFYAKDGQQIGPVEFAEIERLQTEGQLTGDTLVWQQGTANWVKLSTLLAPGPVSPDPVPPAITVTSQNNPLAIASLVLGIVGLLCCGVVLGAGGAVCGHIALNQIRTKGGAGAGLAKAGLILSYIAIALNFIMIAYSAWKISTGDFEIPSSPTGP